MFFLFGGGHAATKVRRNRIGSQGKRYDWLPLGYRLKQYYGSGFSSYNFWLLPENDLLPEAKFLPDKTVNGLFSSSFDGFIFDKEMIGTFYQYNPTDENIKFIFSLVYNYALNRNNASLDVTFFHFDPQGQFMMGIYYLKLYYGDKFNYDFWRIGSTRDLLSSLDDLKQMKHSLPIYGRFTCLVISLLRESNMRRPWVISRPCSGVSLLLVWSSFRLLTRWRLIVRRR